MWEARRREVLTHDKSKVNVEEATIGGQHQVVKVSVPNTKDVRHHAIPSTTPYKCIQHLCFQPKWPCTRRTVSKDVLSLQIDSQNQKMESPPWKTNTAVLRSCNGTREL